MPQRPQTIRSDLVSLALNFSRRFFGGKNEDVLSKFFRMKNKYYFSLQRINVRFAVHTPATFFSGILSRNVALNCSSYPAFPAFFFGMSKKTGNHPLILFRYRRRRSLPSFPP